MIGPKLDARSYTTFLLVVVAVLLTLNLFAQYGDTNRSAQSREYDLKTTDSQAAVAAATREVAEANREIARSLDSVANAISNLKMNVNVATGAQGTPAGTTATAAPASSTSTSGEPDADEKIPYTGNISF